jgi:2-methylcitrate dehydratase PrpD
VTGGATFELAHFAAAYPTERIPSDIIAAFRPLILDTACVMLAGATQPVHRLVREGLAGVLGPGVVHSVGGPQLSLSGAILLDGLAAADFEFEHVMAATHPSSAAFPALLALASEYDLEGHALIAATIMAYELGARIGAACGSATEHERGFHNPGLNGTLAAAAGCARLLGLSPDRVASALGLAGSSASGLMAFLDDGAMTKRLHPARSGQLGFEAALMASAGVDGPRTVLESTHGFLRAFSPKPNLDALTHGLGEMWHGHRMVVKLSPAHAYAQLWVAAVNDARDRGIEWRVEEITSVRLEGPAESFPARHDVRRPATLVDVQYSIPFSVAVALTRDLRNPFVMDEVAAGDPVIIDLAQKVEFHLLSAIGARPRLSIDVASGKCEIEVSRYKGMPGEPGYEQAINDKLARTLGALGIGVFIDPLRQAVQDLGGAGTARALRQILLVAGTAIQKYPGRRPACTHCLAQLDGLG